MAKVSKLSMRKKPKRTGSVIDRIAPVQLDDDSLKISIYGRSGTGKTTLACTFPKPLLIIGAEDGTKSVHNVKGVDFVRIKHSEEMPVLVEHAASENYKTVVLDAATSMQDIILREILGVKTLPTQRSYGMASRDQWGQCSLQTKERLRELLDMQCNVVIIAQERSFNEDSESEAIAPNIGSALTPGATGWLNPACDYICQTFIREGTRIKEIRAGGKVKKVERKTGKMDYCLRTGPHSIYTTKFRLPKGTELPDVIVDPSYEKILSLIQGE